MKKNNNLYMCKFCKHKWGYSGIGIISTNCPKCKNRVDLKYDKIKLAD